MKAARGDQEEAEREDEADRYRRLMAGLRKVALTANFCRKTSVFKILGSRFAFKQAIHLMTFRNAI